MEPNFIFKLERGSKKNICPNCSKKTFVRAIDTVENVYIPEIYGRCDRAAKCGYFRNPYKDGYSKSLYNQNGSNLNVGSTGKFGQDQISRKSVFFDNSTYNKTQNQQRFSKNNFIQNLLNNIPFPFDAGDVMEMAELYRIGTITKGYMSGAVTFPFIDIKQNVRAVQVKLFDIDNHTKTTDYLHRIIDRYNIKNNITNPPWLKEYLKNEKFITCLFGEHLLDKFPNNPVALVEAPKTAIYGTLYLGMPKTDANYIWLAVYNLSSFSLEKLKVLKNRKVFVFPDLSENGIAYETWMKKAMDFEQKIEGVKFTFSGLLEKSATDEQKKQGLDLADILVTQDWRDYR
jgi:hypothetical protein